MSPAPPPAGARRRRIAATVAAVAIATSACAGFSPYVHPRLANGCEGCRAVAEQLDARVVLLGDTGESGIGSQALALAGREARRDPSRTLVLFLGDNVYPRGLPEASPDPADERQAGEWILQQQLDAVRFTGARIAFVPGNHDWDRSGPRGRARVAAQQAFIDRHAYPSTASLVPRDACPGPTTLDIGDRLRVVAIDSEWLLTAPGARRGRQCGWGDAASNQVYDPVDNATFYAKLAEIVAASVDRDLVFAAHHPLRTRGPHGGYVTLRQWIFPLTMFKRWLVLPVPLLYPAVRYWAVRSDQDLAGAGNRAMVGALSAAYAASARSPAVSVAGHEHALQVFEEPGGGLYHLVSGAAAKQEATGVTAGTLFKHAAAGLMVLDYFVDGRIGLRVLEPESEEGATEVFAMWLRR